ncbi:DUF2516 family protein [Mumia sp. zg.B53]|uniref:DUF2516 family protein n=1 Tax=unclassified Mumia TaxID=2621872 RepID=UPI001C6F23D5|nr:MULTISPECIES: DUF2516 family protein [unclassified Mumia]MBW9207188.1 DUF2516 family protein [Mumia sp. zg.B17]MBW9210463.1 DUF2516 family protein [Mumia sp. zg.B21]MBW9215085.1 DUF2516 family protein [Mumia sp. zg.B53]MDD9349499.1 DUF2516 family protein [Mumia sp.]
MFDLFAVQSLVELIITVLMIAAKGFAVVDAVSRSPQAFVAADKQTKPFWVILLALALVANLLIWQPIGILNLAGIVAALVYLADARPALQQVSGR